MNHRVRPRDRQRRSAHQRWLAVGLFVAVVAATTVVEIAFHQAAVQRVAGGTQEPASVSPTLPIGSIIPAAAHGDAYAASFPAMLPQGYDTPTGLAATPEGTGVWFIADSPTARTVFYWSSAKRQLTRFALSMADPGLASGASTPMVVDSDGRVWIGINRTLVMINPASAAVTTYPLPAVALVSSSLEALPPAPPGVSLQSYADIESLTVDSSGDVVVGRQFASALDVYDPADGRFSNIPLPSGTVLAGFGTNLIAGHAGELDALLYDGSDSARLAMWSSSGWSRVEPTCPPVSLLAGISATIVGESCAEVRASGAGTLGATARLVSGDWASNPGITLALSLSSGAMAVEMADGFAVVNVATGKATQVALGQIVVGPSSHQSGGSVPLRIVAVSPGLVAPDGVGGMWFTVGEGGGAIGHLMFT